MAGELFNVSTALTNNIGDLSTNVYNSIFNISTNIMDLSANIPGNMFDLSTNIYSDIYSSIFEVSTNLVNRITDLSNNIPLSSSTNSGGSSVDEEYVLALLDTVNKAETYEVEEPGLYFVDPDGNIGVKIDASGFSAINIIGDVSSSGSGSSSGSTNTSTGSLDFTIIDY